ncbi:MAG: hypothetical protein RXR11_06410 [Caldivirga sp.]
MWPLANITNSRISGNLAWYNNSLVNEITNELPLITNLTEQLKLDAEVYKIKIMYDQAPYYWLPSVLAYMIVQPYVKGIFYNPYLSYCYNTMYYVSFTATFYKTTTTTTTTS